MFNGGDLGGEAGLTDIQDICRKAEAAKSVDCDDIFKLAQCWSHLYSLKLFII